ncbi:MAG TPA: hypothetical protein VFK58_08030 [Sphingomicrobium sp.]|nr:hypothetical protein [Sphingomicrobium sp.]
MRIPAAALAFLLAACGTADDNQAANAEMNAAAASQAAPGGAEPNEAGANGNEPARTSGMPVPDAPGTPEMIANNSDPAEPSGTISLTAAPARARAGETMTLTLRNGSRQQIGYNLCTSRLETAGGRSVPSDRVCTMELRLLGAAQVANYRYDLPARLAAGGYRFATGIDIPGENAGRVIFSNSFDVR